MRNFRIINPQIHLQLLDVVVELEEIKIIILTLLKGQRLIFAGFLILLQLFRISDSIDFTGMII